MGVYHGLYCLGCCWPYFLIMVSRGWMNTAWMSVFAAIIFGEKNLAQGNLDCKVCWNRPHYVRNIEQYGVIMLYDSVIPINTQSENNMVM